MELDSQTSRGWYIAPRTSNNSDETGSPQPLTRGTPSSRIYFKAMLDLIDLVGRGHVGAISWPQRLTRPGLSHSGCLETSLRWGNLKKATNDSSQNVVCRESWSASLRLLRVGGADSEPNGELGPIRPVGSFPHRDSFDQLFGEVVFPAYLLELTLGETFNQPITGIELPASLLELTFGRDFNQPIAGTVWPSSLLRLTFGESYN